tara:strand:+ start:3246 stop:4598 length:1353 start_codon:yes stop_codon:yes gene_type:complete
MKANTPSRTPVTVLTGFLGAGKTTLLNRILTEEHGQRIAVIENEFGEIGIDHEIVISSEEEIFEMNNGCICCNVRGDLLRVLGNLMKRRDKFDHILIETTGLADPGPVVQTFFVDDDLKRQMDVNAVVTLVDAKHVVEHLDDSNEAREQIAFADVILLNKCDLVSESQLDEVEARIKAMNGMAKLHRTTNSTLPIDQILQVGGFDLQRAVGSDPLFLDPEYPFEWGGIIETHGGELELVTEQNPNPRMKTVILPVADATEAALSVAREQAVGIFSTSGKIETPSGCPLSVGMLHELLLREGQMRWPLASLTGLHAVFTQHDPEDVRLEMRENDLLLVPSLTAAYKPYYQHQRDETVSSVAIQSDRECDGEKLNAWITKLLRERGKDIFRMKGVFAVQGRSYRVIFQGVHMLLDAQNGGEWEDRPRKSSLVFIGRNLDREELTESFLECQV